MVVANWDSFEFGVRNGEPWDGSNLGSDWDMIIAIFWSYLLPNYKGVWPSITRGVAIAEVRLRSPAVEASNFFSSKTQFCLSLLLIVGKVYG